MNRGTLAFAVAVSAALHAQGQQQPAFRSGAELVRIEAHVVARDGTPIEGLRPDQFEVFIDGRRRPVTMAEFVRASVSVGDPGGTTVAPPSTASPGQDGRIIVVAVDQASFPFAARASAIEAARRVVTRAAPEDHLGIVLYPNGAAVAPTRDRKPALNAIGTIIGDRGDLRRSRFNISASEASALRSRDSFKTQEIIARECTRRDPLDATCKAEVIQDGAVIAEELEYQAVKSIAGLHGVLEGMATLPPGRKTLIVVSAGLPMAASPGGRPDPSSAIEEVARRAAAANINLYVLYMNVHFMRAFSAEYGRQHNTIYDDITMFGYGLEKFADTAGGAFFQVEVDSDPFVGRALRETSASYVLAVDVRPEDRDGKPHHIRLNVKHRGATVRYRRVVVIPAAQEDPPPATR
jgi:VWFA-related protein